MESLTRNYRHLAFSSSAARMNLDQELTFVVKRTLYQFPLLELLLSATAFHDVKLLPF